MWVQASHTCEDSEAWRIAKRSPPSLPSVQLREVIAPWTHGPNRPYSATLRDPRRPCDVVGTVCSRSKDGIVVSRGCWEVGRRLKSSRQHEKSCALYCRAVLHCFSK